MQQKDLQQVSVGRAALSPAAVPHGNAGASLPAAVHFKWEARRKHMSCPSVQLPHCEGHPRTLSQANHHFMGPQISKSA